MGKRHNDLTPHIEAPRTRKKQGQWTRKKVKAHRALHAHLRGESRAPGARRAAREASRQSSVQAFMKHMEQVSRDDWARKKRLEREREEKARGGT